MNSSLLIFTEYQSMSSIFRPQDDAVYISNEDEREEYVLNDHGRIWVGSERNFSGIPWNFGQVSMNGVSW